LFPFSRSHKIKGRILLSSDVAVPAQVFEEQGFGPLEGEYLSSWMHTGQQVHFAGDSTAGSLGDAAQHPGSSSSLVIQGLSPSGFLRAEELSTGHCFELQPDGNSLDLMSGLVCRKLQT
jgi:biotin--protein ligase